MRFTVALVAVGVSLVLLYLFIDFLRPGAGEATPTQDSLRQEVPTPQQNVDKRPSGETTGAPAPNATTQQYEAAREAAAVHIPRLEVAVVAPDVVNTTVLPVEIRYSVVVKNVGNGTAIVDVQGVQHRIEPGDAVVLNLSILVRRGGVHEVGAYINGTFYRKDIVVYFYMPRLVAEPVRVETTRLPDKLTIYVRVRNIGNLTARVGEVEIPPGGEASVSIDFTAVSPGRFILQLGDLEVPVEVVYYTPNLSWRVGGLEEVEAVPGERYAAWLWLKNVGNGTAHIEVNGRKVVLQPQEEVNITSTATITTAGVYRYIFEVKGDVNMSIVYNTRVRIISTWVEIAIFSPEIRRAWPRTVDETSLTLGARESTLLWGYIVYSNATRRTIQLEIEDPSGRRLYELRPGGEIAQNFTIRVKAPGEETLWVRVNSTTYQFKVTLALSRPKISVSHISRIEYSDERALLSLKITCLFEGIPFTVVFDVLKVSGVVEYGRAVRTAQGSVTVRSAAGTFTGSYTGRLEGSRGWATLRILGEEINVEFTTPPLTVTRILRGRQPVECSLPTGLIPALLHRELPTTRGEEDAGEYIYRIFAAFARESGEVPQSIVWNGEYFEVVDRRGFSHRVYIEGGRIVIQGPLSATIVIS